MYRLRNGFDPQQGGIVRLTELSQPGWFDWLGVGATALMLATAVLLVRWAVKAEALPRALETPEART
jgi:cell division protein FtsX